MAGKKKVGHVGPGQMQVSTAGSADSKPSPAPAVARPKAAGMGQQEHRCSSSANRATDSAAITAVGLPDAVAVLHLATEGKAPAPQAAAVASQQPPQQQQQRGMQARMSGPSSATDRVGRTGTPTTTPDIPMLLARLNSISSSSSRMSEPEQVQLLKQVLNTAVFYHEHRAALLTGGIIPTLLRVLHSSGKAVQDGVLETMMELLCRPTSEAGLASIKSSIPQLVPLVRSRNQDIQYNALEWLAQLSFHSHSLGQCMVAAGAIPAVTEALHKGLEKSRLVAAQLLQQLAAAGGMDFDTALAGAVPAMVSVLQRGEPDMQLAAASMLRIWVFRSAECCKIAVAQGAVPPLVPLLYSQDEYTQAQVTALLHGLVVMGGGAQAAAEEGAIPALVQLLQVRNGLMSFFAAEALQFMLAKCSQAASIAAAAGAIPPLVRMLASNLTYNNSAEASNGNEDVSSTHVLTPLHGKDAPSGSEVRQTVPASSLCSMAGAGDTQICTAMVEAGAVAALSAALHSEHQLVRQLALRTLQSLMEDPSSKSAAAARLVVLLHNHKLPKMQAHAAAAVSELSTKDSCKSAMVAAGVVTALASLLATRPDAATLGSATCALCNLFCGQQDAAAVLEAGAAPALVQLLQGSSDTGTKQDAATVLCNLAGYLGPHDQLAEVIPQLLQAMHSEDHKLQVLAGCTLQLLARTPTTSTTCAFRADEPLWEALMASTCSEAQRYAAAAIHLSVMGYRCSKEEKIVFESVRFISPDKSASQWKPLLIPE